MYDAQVEAAKLMERSNVSELGIGDMGIVFVSGQVHSRERVERGHKEDHRTLNGGVHSFWHFLVLVAA